MAERKDILSLQAIHHIPTLGLRAPIGPKPITLINRLAMLITAAILVQESSAVNLKANDQHISLAIIQNGRKTSSSKPDFLSTLKDSHFIQEFPSHSTKMRVKQLDENNAATSKRSTVTVLHASFHKAQGNHKELTNSESPSATSLSQSLSSLPIGQEKAHALKDKNSATSTIVGFAEMANSKGKSSTDRQRIFLESLESRSADSLEDEIRAVKKEILKIKTNYKKQEEARMLKALARDFIDQAYKEKDLKMRQKFIKFGVELNEHPIELITKLKNETKTKDEAALLLKKARKEKNLDEQEKLMLRAEKKIYWLETGKGIKNLKELKKAREEVQNRSLSNSTLINNRPVIIENQTKNESKTTNQSNNTNSTTPSETKKKEKPVIPNFNKTDIQIAREIAQDLVKLAQNETDTAKKDHLLATAYDLLHDPHNALQEYRRTEWKKHVIRNKSLDLLKEVTKLSSEEKKLALIARLQQFYKEPLEEVQKIRDAELDLQYKEAKSIAIQLLKQAKGDKNLASQEITIRAAKKLMEYPISTVVHMNNTRKTKLFLEKVPSACQSVVQTAFDRHHSGLTDYDYNRIEEKVQSRIKAFSEGKKFDIPVLGTSHVSLAQQSYQSNEHLLKDAHLNSVLADSLADFLEDTYKKVSDPIS
jgi:hypothetical protein